MSGAIKLARANFQGDRGYARAMPGTGYAGDPGLFGTIFGGIKKGFQAASRFIPGGGAISTTLGALGSIASRIRSRRASPRQIGTRRGRAEMMVLPSTPFQMPPPLAVSGGPNGAQYPIPTAKGARQRFFPGGASGMFTVPQGYHLNKSGYYRGGRPKSDIPNVEWVEAESIAVKNRKRNPLNPRAWDRAFGRLNSAQNFKKKMGRLTIREKC